MAMATHAPVMAAVQCAAISLQYIAIQDHGAFA